MGRTLLGIVAGLVVMFIVIAGIEALGHLIHPPPSGLDPMDPTRQAEFEQYIQSMPLLPKLMLALAWVSGAFAGGWTAARLAVHPRVAALVVALAVTSGVVGMIVAVPHPSWLAAAGLILPLPAALLATRLARPVVKPSGSAN